MTFGLTSNGFTIPGQQDLIDDINQREQAKFGASFDVSADSPEGQLNGVFATKLSEIWELAQAVWSASTVDGATGVQLDQLLQLTGVTRLPATYSTGSVVLGGTNGTSVPTSTQLAVSGVAANVFATNSTAVIATATAWVAGTAYVVGAIVSNDTGKLYSTTIAGTSAGSGGPTGTGTAITDSTVTWRYIATAAAAIAVPVTAIALGPTIAAAGGLTVINTPVGGLSSVVNPLDATVGRNVETDAAARIRRAALLRNEGLASADAIQSKVLQVSGVTQAFVIDNPTSSTDANGTPPYSFQTVVSGGADQDVANAIWAAKPAGIQAYGSTTKTVTDASGNSQTVGLTRPTAVPIYISVTLNKSAVAGIYAGDAAVQAALVAYGNTILSGSNVRRNMLFGPVEAVAGVIDITALTIGTAPAPAGTSNISITALQQATFDTSRVVVTPS